MNSEKYNIVSNLLENHISLGMGERIAIEDEYGCCKYQELWQMVLYLQLQITQLGMVPAEIVLCVFYDTINSVAFILALMRAGCVPCIVNAELPIQQYSYYVEKSKTKYVIYDNAMSKDLIDYFNKLDVKTFGIDQNKIKKRVTNNVKIHLGSSDRIAFCLFTSGSTGEPKAVIHRHKDIEVTNENYVKNIVSINQGETLFSTSKIFFAYGLNSVFYALYHVAKVILSDRKLDLKKIIKRLTNTSVDIFLSVPTVYAMLLKQQNNTSQSLTTRLNISAGEHLPVNIQEAWRKKFGQVIIDGIGATEILSTFISNSVQDYKIGSTGKLVPGFNAKILDTQMNAVSIDKVGILWIKGDTYATEYLNDNKNSVEQFHDGWFKTNDLFSVDKEGFYSYHGRINDLIKCGGVWIYPYKIEEKIACHPCVDECAVVGLLQENGLYRPAAFVVINSDIPYEKLVNELKTLCKTELSRWEYPHFVYIVDSIPKTPTGKKKRCLLKERVHD